MGPGRRAVGGPRWKEARGGVFNPRLYAEFLIGKLAIFVEAQMTSKLRSEACAGVSSSPWFVERLR